MAKLRYEILAEKLQIKRYFYVEYTTLFLFGFDLNSRDKTFHRPWFSFSTIISAAILQIFIIHFCFLNIQEIDKVVDVLGPLVQMCKANWKFIILFQKRQEIVELVHRIWELTENANEAELKILARENKRANLFNITFCRIIAITVFFGGFSLPLISALQYVLSGKFGYQVILAAAYPIKLESPLNYCLIYCWNVYSLYGLISVVIGSDTLYTWSSHNVAAQFCVLQHKIESLSHLTKRVGGSNNIIRKSIVDCISYHQQIIDLADNLNRIFRPIAFAEYSINSVQVCLIAFLLLRTVEISRGLYLFFFLLTVMSQILMYSYGGQHLEDESEQVSTSAFQSINWEFWSISERKMLLLVMVRAQRACKITAVFFNVNMNSFVTVLRSAGSYITLLWSLSKT